MEKHEFLDRIDALFGFPLAEMSDEQVQWALNLAQYAWDLTVAEAERRGLIGELNGYPFLEYDLPDGVEEVTHFLRMEASEAPDIEPAKPLDAFLANIGRASPDRDASSS